MIRHLRRASRPRVAAWPALVLAIGLLSQAWLAVVHAESHTLQLPGAAGALAHHHDGGHPRPGHGHGDHRPGRSDDGCRLCAGIAAGKLGWASPGPAVVAEAAEAPSGVSVSRAERAIECHLASTAPRGPPAA
ncbi:MAG: hypothetical protein IT436_11115 [Phycisphaerales bacterium]|nr:hypothetical protein [Phycisphaerales bacterium]